MPCCPCSLLKWFRTGGARGPVVGITSARPPRDGGRAGEDSRSPGLTGATLNAAPSSLTDLCTTATDICMRTTLALDDHLFREAKARAARDGETLTRLVERAVRQYLRNQPEPREPYRLELIISEGSPTPGVNLDDRDALYEWMERGEDRVGRS
ncbi:MAG: hypothetical protein F4Y45_05210 [Acidobacteria bacterium]|nr:hypothetical protein [Acidobacteriota bacterium]MYJ04511.1 hypothetical protein [Acidobacteriota bacterium]